MWLIWPAPLLGGARRMEFGKSQKRQNWLSLGQGRGQTGPDRGFGMKISDHAGGGPSPERNFGQFQPIITWLKCTDQIKIVFIHHRPELLLIANNGKSLSIKNSWANNCSSIWGQGSNWHLNKLNARSDPMIRNLFWINSGEALIGTHPWAGDWRPGFTLTLQVIMDT